MISTRSDICKHIKYVSTPIYITVNNERTRKQQAILELNRRLSGNHDLPCMCSKCRTDSYGGKV